MITVLVTQRNKTGAQRTYQQIQTVDAMRALRSVEMIFDLYPMGKLECAHDTYTLERVVIDADGRVHEFKGSTPGGACVECSLALATCLSAGTGHD